MERKNPSNPDNPSAHYIQPSPALQSIIDDTFNYATTKTAPSLAEAEKAARTAIAIGRGLLRLTGGLLKPGGV